MQFIHVLSNLHSVTHSIFFVLRTIQIATVPLVESIQIGLAFLNTQTYKNLQGRFTKFLAFQQVQLKQLSLPNISDNPSQVLASAHVPMFKSLKATREPKPLGSCTNLIISKKGSFPKQIGQP